MYGQLFFGRGVVEPVDRFVTGGGAASCRGLTNRADSNVGIFQRQPTRNLTWVRDRLRSDKKQALNTSSSTHA